MWPDVETFDELIELIASENRQSSENNSTEPFSLAELSMAEDLILKRVQNDVFSDEFKILRSNKSLTQSSKYASLSLFLDTNNLIRVGGRLKKSGIPFDAKHQILLPSKHLVTALLVKHYHQRCMHGGPKLTESMMRQKCWICSAQRTIKSFLRACVECFRANPRPMDQYMADLPSVRVTAVDKPFTNTAVDYTGAIHVKMSTVRGCKTHKAYIADFVCMATKAIHIEAVTDLTAEAFIAALKRFIARRGSVQRLYSDNGTNFVKSNTVLQEDHEIANEDEYNRSICRELAKNKIEWCFSPAGSPHFNGLAEAGVKSVKLHTQKLY